MKCPAYAQISSELSHLSCTLSVIWHSFFPLRKHAYSNILKILPTKKKWKFSDKNSDIFHIPAQNIDCGYSLEPPRRGGSNECHILWFWAEIRKIMYTPVNPSFTIWCSRDVFLFFFFFFFVYYENRNPQTRRMVWHVSRTNCHGSKDVRPSEVLLYIFKSGFEFNIRMKWILFSL